MRYSSQCLKRDWVVERGEKHGQRFDLEDYFHVECKPQAGFPHYHCPVTDFPFTCPLQTNTISQILASTWPPCLLFHGENGNSRKITSIPSNHRFCQAACSFTHIFWFPSHKNGCAVCAPMYLPDLCKSFLVLSHLFRDFVPAIMPLSPALSAFHSLGYYSCQPINSSH